MHVGAEASILRQSYSLTCTVRDRLAALLGVVVVTIALGDYLCRRLVRSAKNV